jgi:phenylalanyl-tRNA synthetase beta chain
MKVPISWLKDYVALEASPQELAEKLTFSGIEVEGIETVGAELPGVIVGEIVSFAPHPNADRLRVCQVSDGAQTVQVVCGAANFNAGDKAAFAPVGTRLSADFVIRKAKLRGEESLGMLCAKDELGLGDDHSGIMLVARDIPAGTPLAQVIGPPETVLELEITWNRPDSLSIIGIAREFAALYDLPLKRPAADFPAAAGAIGDWVQVTIDDPSGCPRYTARLIRDVKLGPSPAWMQKRLALCGVRPINNVVDITNYVMLECGQPLHAFDHRLIGGRKIEVRRVRPGETMATLDGIDRPLTPEMLVIADAERPVALAGIMGGAGSEINDDTQTVLLESAVFNPADIHRTSVKLGLATESSRRFERTVDMEGAEWASRRAAALLAAHAGGTVLQSSCDAYPGQQAPRRIACRFQRVRDLLGIAIPNEAILSIFKRLALPVVSQDTAVCEVEAPSFRPDLQLEADLIEEVARMHGLENVPAVTPVARINPDIDDARPRAVIDLRNRLTGFGLSEIMNYSFTSEALLGRFPTPAAARRVVLPNPVSADYAVMRESLLPQMVDTLGRNLSYQTTDAMVYEIGRVFARDAQREVGESEQLCIGLMGKAGRAGLARRQAADPEEIFLWLKGVIEQLCGAQRIRQLQFVPADQACFDPGCAARVVIDGREAGWMGLLSAASRKEWRIFEPVAVAELALDALLGHAYDLPALQKLSAYPSVTRDIAMIVEEKIQHEDIVAIIRKAAPKELTTISLFDIFRGKGIGDHRKSIAYSLVYRSLERSLTDEDVNTYHEAIRGALKSGVGAEFREG